MKKKQVIFFDHEHGFKITRFVINHKTWSHDMNGATDASYTRSRNVGPFFRTCHVFGIEQWFYDLILGLNCLLLLAL